MSETFLKAQAEARAKAWESAKALLDRASEEKRDLTAEEQVQFDRINSELDERAAAIDNIRRIEEREAKAAEAARGFEVVTGASASDTDLLRAIARGEVRSHNFEARTLTPSENLVPVTFFDQVWQKAREVGPMLRVSNILNTASGEDIRFPNLTAYSTAAQVAAGGTIGASDPTFSSVVLGAYKQAFLVAVAEELLSDSGVNLEDELARAGGNSIGTQVNTLLTTGSGSDEPNGAVTAASSAVAGTAALGIPTGDNIVDLFYSLDGAVRSAPGFAFMASPTTIASIRKIKDTTGQYLFQPSLALGTPDTLLGRALIENPAMASGTSAKSIVAGDWNAYRVRVAGGLQVAQSSDYQFNLGLVNYRFQIRVDGDLMDSAALKYYVGATA
jgi:HK97 family phage major capsid protein